MPQRKNKKVFGLLTKYVHTGQVYIDTIPEGLVLDDTNFMGENINIMTEAEGILGASKEADPRRITQKNKPISMPMSCHHNERLDVKTTTANKFFCGNVQTFWNDSKKPKLDSGRVKSRLNAGNDTFNSESLSYNFNLTV